ncbi:hypothetical protein [Tardiphaga sp.]|uniref:hypothetical protein n=1 Tax=Tardiphaga sp. TaxID=1926292 RepID=UPI0037DA429A
MIWRVVLFGGAFVASVMSVQTYAADANVPLLEADDLRAAPTTGLQGVNGGATGAIHYPDEILAYPIAETPENKSLLQAWKASHRFFVIPFELSIAPGPSQTPVRVDISMAFAGLGAMDKQPLVIDVFPETGFTPGPVAATGEARIGGDLKFQSPLATASTGANASVTFKYAPSFPTVIAGFGSGSAFWQFMKSQERQPVGGMPLKLIVACPIPVGKSLVLTTDVRVAYEGEWWKKGLSVASFRTKVAFPPEQEAPK